MKKVSLYALRKRSRVTLRGHWDWVYLYTDKDESSEKYLDVVCYFWFKKVMGITLPKDVVTKLAFSAWRVK